ncbi:RNA polymerase sigma factor [Archangium lansingense]|uniref:Sigma-70 family RNA polymerase sigma factor n=1 Tax=Archangium lansingense TaxID=2995310 RepID=A0ABT4APS8_9BACT|nr:sigma-70 family RNA polymerase sigma factor [Archangium lansinium]MCY1083606.1 sigma-70 family RNA polymerase sigma factor [Archangium lansinium]
MNGPAHRRLLLAAQAGDSEAMERLLAYAQPDIRRYAQRHCMATAADDVVQETLSIVYRRMGALRDVAAFGGWVMRIVHRLCMRPLQVWLKGEPLEQVEDSPAWARRPVHELRMDLARAIESLPPLYREALLLRDFEELTIGEMAQRLGTSREAAKSRLHRARALVREYLQGESTT